MPPIVALLKEILLDVRGIERRNAGAVVLNITSHIAKRLRTGEITDHWNEEVLSLQIANNLKILFAGKIAAGLSLLIGCRHQVRISSPKSAKACSRVTK